MIAVLIVWEVSPGLHTGAELHAGNPGNAECVVSRGCIPLYVQREGEHLNAVESVNLGPRSVLLSLPAPSYSFFKHILSDSRMSLHNSLSSTFH